eukprot:superscaffoldBa00000047_g807
MADKDDRYHIDKAVFTAFGKYQKQAEDLVKPLVNEIKNLHPLILENNELKRKITFFELNEEQVTYLKKDVADLKVQLKLKKDFANSWRYDKEYLIQQAEQLKQVSKERDLLSKELLHYKRQCLTLKKTNKDLRETLNKRESHLTEKSHVLELEVEKLQREKSSLENTVLIAKTNSDRLAQKDKEILRKEKKRYSDLELQLEQSRKEPEYIPESTVVFTLQFYNNGDVIKEHEEHDQLKKKLVTTKQELVAIGRQLEKSCQKIKAKERECEQLKSSIPRLLPPETIEEIPKLHRIIREQSKRIKVLMAEANVFEIKAEEYKRDKEKLVERVAEIKKMYLNEKMQKRDLEEALRRSEVQKVPQDTPRASQIPMILNSIVLHKRTREKQGLTESQTIKSKQKSKVQPQVPTITKKVVLKSEEKSGQTYLPPIDKHIPHKTKIKTLHAPLPPITRKSQVKPVAAQSAFQP